MSEITKEELAAFTDAHSRSAIALERITDRLEDIALKQDKIIDKLTNGVTHNIIEGVTTNYNATHKETIASLDRIEASNKPEAVKTMLKETIDNSSMAKDVGYAKWFIGIVGLVVIVALVIIRGIDTRIVVNKDLRSEIKKIIAQDTISDPNTNNIGK